MLQLSTPCAAKCREDGSEYFLTLDGLEIDLPTRIRMQILGEWHDSAVLGEPRYFHQRDVARSTNG